MLTKLVYFVLLTVNAQRTITVDDIVTHQRQSPINIWTDREMYGQENTVTSDPAFSFNYGPVSKKDMISPNNGVSLQFNIDNNDYGHFTTSLVNKWFPEIESMTFKPKQFHFHHGTDHSNQSENGSEHTFNGKHMDAELHIVHLNENPETKDKFWGAVTGILF